MKKPKIRFKGFTETWEQRKLGDVFKEYSEKNHGELPALTIVQGQGTIYRNESERNLMYEKSNLSSYKMVRKNDFIVHLRSFEGGLEIATLDGIISPAYHTLHGDNTDSRFYYSYFRSYEFINHGLVPHVYGIRDGRSIDIAGMKTILIPYTSFDEQKKIGNYIETIDHLITLHQRQCENLKKVKKFMLQKLFPQNGENVPKVRFSGFTDTWEQRKLDKIFISLQNNTLSRSDLSNQEGIAYNIHYGDVLIKFNDVLNVSNEKIPMIKNINALKKFKSSHLQNGDIVVADTAEDETVGKCCEIQGITDEIVISGLHTIPYRPLINFGDGYLGYYLNSNSYHHQLLPLMQGIKVTSISKSSLKDTSVLFPKQITEQEKIGSLFSKLDNLITLHQSKCDNLKEVKKYMLQNMFI